MVRAQRRDTTIEIGRSIDSYETSPMIYYIGWAQRNNTIVVYLSLAVGYVFAPKGVIEANIGDSFQLFSASFTIADLEGDSLIIEWN